MEAGYGDSPEDAAATARGLVDAGGVGLNLEDTADAGDDPLLSIDAFVAKIAAVRAVAGDDRRRRSCSTPAPTSSSARSATRRHGSSAPSSAGGPTSMRAPTASSSRPSPTPPRSARWSQGIGGPVSILAGPGSPTLAELAALGVARVSVGSGAYRAALALARRMAEEAYAEGRLDAMTAAQVSFADAQTLFER